MIILVIVLVMAIAVISPSQLQVNSPVYTPPYTSVNQPHTVFIVLKVDPMKYMPLGKAGNLTVNNLTPVYTIPSSTPLEELILRLLGYNATQITPSVYWESASLGGVWANSTRAGNVTYVLHTYLFNGSGNSTEYVIVIQGYNVSDYYVAYPPSDNVSYGQLDPIIIDSYNVNTQVNPVISVSQQLVNSYAIGSFCSGHVTYYQYYDAQVVYNFRYFVDQNGSTMLYDQYKGTLALSYDSSGQISHTAPYTAIVPPGVPEDVSATAGLSWSPGHSVSSGSGVYVYYTHVCHHYHEGNRTITRCYWVKHECHYTYTVNTYYPSIHSFANVMSDTWYKYNVSLPITIKVYNGTSPTTQITSRFFSATSPLMTLNTTAWYTTWSSLPLSNSYRITTRDIVNFVNYTVPRSWNAGNITVNPVPSENSSTYTFPILLGTGNETSIQHLLGFYVTPDLVSQPSWVFRHVPQSQVYSHNYASQLYQYMAYASISRTLWNISRNFSYPLTEYHILASEISLNMTVNNESYPASPIPLLEALWHRGGNTTLVNDQAFALDSFVTYENLTWGTGYWYREFPSHEYGYVVVNDLTTGGISPYPYAISNATNETVILSDVAVQQTPFAVPYFYLQNGSTVETFTPQFTGVIEMYQGWRWGPWIIDFAKNVTWVNVLGYAYV